MQLAWRSLWQNREGWLKAGWLITAGLVALYVGTVQVYENRGVSRSTGIAESVWDPISSWQAPLYDRTFPAGERQVRGVVGGIPGAPDRTRLPSAAMIGPSGSQPQTPADDRKMARNSSISLVAKNPGDTAEKIRQLAQRLGGFLVTSTTTGAEGAPFASLTIRVPASRFEEAGAEIRKMGLRVESERVEGQDVTKQYVDMDAHLRNLRAEEAQYLSIMKRANTVKDTLEVSEQLSNVRGQIEQQQAEFEALSKQVETVAIAISVHSEAEAQVFGLRWRPLYQLKVAARDGLDSLANYTAVMAALAFLLPTILLWLLTILLVAAFGWRILRWAGHVFFHLPQAAASLAPGR